MDSDVIDMLCARIAQLELEKARLAVTLNRANSNIEQLGRFIADRQKETEVQDDATGHDPVQGNNA